MHHKLDRSYYTSYRYALDEKKWSEYIEYVSKQLNLGVVFFLGGIPLFVISAILADNILCPRYIYLIAFFVPPIATTIWSKEHIFFLANIRILRIQNRVCSNESSKIKLWAITIFANLIIVGSLSLTILTSSSHLFASSKTHNETVYITKIVESKETGNRTAYIRFEDGFENRIYNANKSWQAHTYQSIKLRNSIFGIRIYSE